MCLVEGTHREHVRLVDVDAPEVSHVDGTLSNTQFEVGSWQVANVDGLCVVGQVYHGELNGSILSTIYIRLWLYVV